MKISLRSILFCISFLMLFTINVKSQDISCEILNYGQYNDSVVFITKQFGQKTSRIKLSEPTTVMSDSIFLMKGAEFGVDLLFRSVDTNAIVHLIITWVFPKKMETAKGLKDRTTYEGASDMDRRYRVSLKLRDEEDLVEGIWTLIVGYAPGKEVRKEFFLYTRG